MRMMKTNKNETIMVIGIDHGYGNMKTATRCFPSGVARYEKEPIFQNNLLVYNGMYYQIGEEHKEFCAEKTQDEDYYVLTLAAIARELEGKGRGFSGKSRDSYPGWSERIRSDGYGKESV